MWNLFKVKNKDIPKGCQWHRSVVSIVNFEQISKIVFGFFTVGFEQVNAIWEYNYE